MLGCFGVAPPGGQAISTATSGQHGGNMDYRGFVSGVTVYFPVFVPGALLLVGDGHAIQGDGEISGTGIEISFDVRFTVDLLKGKQIHWPRGENEAYIFTVGNARPLDQALQHATTEMVRWLQDDSDYPRARRARCSAIAWSTTSATSSIPPTPWSARCPSGSCRERRERCAHQSRRQGSSFRPAREVRNRALEESVASEPMSRPMLC